MRNVVVLGVGMHAFGKFPNKNLNDLSREVIWNAIHDSRIDPREIGVAYVGNSYAGILQGQESGRAAVVIRNSGLGGMPMIHVESASASGSIAFHESLLAIRSGMCDMALALGVEKLYVPGDPSASIAAISTSGERTVAVDMGLTWIADLSMSAQRLMDKYHWTIEQIAKVAHKSRYNASLNPLAEVQEPLSLEEILNARVVAYPVTRPMCASAAVDGAAAAILCSEEMARRHTRNGAVTVAACVLKGGEYVPPGEIDTLPGMLSMDLTPQVFAEAYERAGIGPEDVDLAQCHDSISPEELLAYQVMGFCKPGEEGKMIDEGRTTLTGDIPFNTDGGLLARGHPIAATGLAQVCEAVWQLRREAGKRQIAGRKGTGPRVAAIQNAGAQTVAGGSGIGVSVGIILKR